MSAPWYSDDRRYDDEPRVFPAEVRAAVAAEREAKRKRDAEINARVHAKFGEKCDAKARPLVSILTKNRARVYMRQPWQLDMIFPGLSTKPAGFVIDIVASEQERVDRFVGFSGSVRPINLRAAALYGRWLRRFGERADDDATIDREAEQAILQAAE